MVSPRSFSSACQGQTIDRKGNVGVCPRSIRNVLYTIRSTVKNTTNPKLCAFVRRDKTCLKKKKPKNKENSKD